MRDRYRDERDVVLNPQRGSGGPSEQEWEEALNRRDRASGPGPNERDAAILHLSAGQVDSIQSTLRGKHGYVIRIGIGSDRTIGLIASGGSWTLQTSVREIYRGAVFSQPISGYPNTSLQTRVPVKGVVFYSRADAIYLNVQNLGGGGAIYDISAGIIPCEGAPLEEIQPVDSIAGLLTSMPEFVYQWGVDVEGGVLAGDSVDVFDYTGTLIVTYPASEGMIKHVKNGQASLRYISTGVPPILVTFKNFIRK